MSFEDYWYVVAESRELPHDRPISRVVLGERLVCFRDEQGRPTALRDRCLHRNAPLSGGAVCGGKLVCPYHGWAYDGAGRVVAIPSLGTKTLDHRSTPYPAAEQDGFIYVRLALQPRVATAPFRMPHFGERGWRSVRLQNRFRNTVANCVENFIDIPHTAFVHEGLFRSSQGKRISAVVTRNGGSVHVVYRNESDNLGRYRWLLNPGGAPVHHTDSFHAPNVTSVVYEIGRKTFIITSQATPLADDDTLVYTDVTYSLGALTPFVAPFVSGYAQRIIDQDVAILARQMENLQRYGREFRDTPSDLIHRFVDSIRAAIEQGEDPRTLPPLSHEIEFYV